MGGAVDVMIALHGQLSCSIRIPACVWFPARVWILAKDKSNSIARTATLRDQRDKVLFIDAKNLDQAFFKASRNM